MIKKWQSRLTWEIPPLFVQLDGEWMGYRRMLAAVLGDAGERISPPFLLNLSSEGGAQDAVIYVNILHFWLLE